MNWLAHLVLSEADPAFKVGNVLTDILPVGELRSLPPAFQRGIERHRAIDAFTDSHAVYRRSVARLNAPYRRFGGVVIDVFYDHVLTTQWHRHSDLSLGDFVRNFYRDVEMCRLEIPAGALSIFQRMQTGAWLETYGDLDGVRLTLNRIARRLRRPFDLGAVTLELETHYEPLCHDFSEFFPLIRAQFSDRQPEIHPLP